MARWALAVALTATALAALPLLLMTGIDVPDDVLHYDIAGWEWLHHAFTERVSPFFVPGKLGGVSIYNDTASPFYPPTWALFAVPPWLAWPASRFLHIVGSVLTVRWYARTLGASPVAATLAGAALGLGVVGTAAGIDGRESAWTLWLPVVLGAMERVRGSEDRLARGRWATVAGAALALLLLGAHLRVGVAACGVLGLWWLIGGVPRGWFLVALALGVAGGAPAVLPALAEYGNTHSGGGGSPLSGLIHWPVQDGPTPWNAVGWLAPEPWVNVGHYGWGVVLFLSLLLVGPTGSLAPGGRGAARPAGRLLLLGGLVWGAAIAANWPVGRVIFAPLLMLSHPVNAPLATIGTVLVAGPAALALDRLLQLERADVTRRALRVGLPVVAVLLAAGAWLTTTDPYPGDEPEGLMRLALLQGAVAVGLTAAAVALTRGQRRIAIVFVVGVLDLAAVSARMQTAVPSQAITLRGRVDVPGVEGLADGFADLHEISRVEEFVYASPDDEDASAEGRPAADGPRPLDFWAEDAKATQDDMLHRRWPAHLAMATGARGLGGRSKLPPARALQALAPLRQEIGEAQDPSVLERLFEEGQPGRGTLALHGVPVAVDPLGNRYEVEQLSPRCRGPRALQYVGDRPSQIARVIGAPPLADEPAVVEDQELERPEAAAGATVRCDAPGVIEVSASQESVVSLRERFHDGWRFTSETTGALQPFPVDVVHTAVMVPAGEHVIRYRFVPPGLRLSLAAAFGAWGLWLGGLLWLRRRSAG